MLALQQAARRLGVSAATLIELCDEQILACTRDGCTDDTAGIWLSVADVEHCRQLCALDAAELLPSHFRSLDAVSCLQAVNSKNHSSDKPSHYASHSA